MVTTRKERKEFFDRALALRNSGNAEEACKILAFLIRESPLSSAFYAIKGSIHRDLRQLEEATWCFSRAVELKPELELVSLGLFHSLWEQDEQIAAMEEIKRFILAGGISRDYREIIAEATENVLAGLHKEPLMSKIMEIHQIMKEKSGKNPGT